MIVAARSASSGGHSSAAAAPRQQGWLEAFVDSISAKPEEKANTVDCRQGARARRLSADERRQLPIGGCAQPATGARDREQVRVLMAVTEGRQLTRSLGSKRLAAADGIGGRRGFVA